ncbi:hypothetical protein [Gracilibacillus phocaeensis]|uniref:hypothetical protein n=1 Tax=Gracilibacillus phocaeensis TaxID=2042304 RepID=UPI0010315B81|nr:hypothetical protein [Gracilibacillus phocaeensis]
MQQPTSKPLGFGEILDQTFRIIKSNFKELFMISFWVIIPIIVLQTLLLTLTGRSFIFGGDIGEGAFNQLINGAESIATTSPIDDLTSSLISLLILFALPILGGGIIWTVKYAREGQKPVAKEMIKKALPRYWPMFWSTLLIVLIVFAAIFFPILIVAFIIGMFLVIEPIMGAIMAILLGLGFFIGLGLLFTRFTLFLPAVLFEKVAPGLGKSWHLTKKQTWKFFGLFIILSIITSVISMIISIPLTFLGDSVLYHVLSNVFSLVTTIIFIVGYAVIYFESTIRQEGTDLKSMIDEYHTSESH